MRSTTILFVFATFGCEAPPSSKQTSVPGPPVAVAGESCEATLGCYSGCDDESCRAACDAKAVVGAATLGRAALQCISKSGCADQECALKACAAELERCVNGAVAAGETAPVATPNPPVADTAPPSAGGGAPDGTYKKPPGSTDGGPSMKFTVSDAGKRITDFSGTISGSCGGTGSIKLSSFVSSMTVAADGTFSGTETLSESTTEVSGTVFSNGTASGTVTVRVSGCAGGPRAWITARL